MEKTDVEYNVVESKCKAHLENYYTIFRFNKSYNDDDFKAEMRRKEAERDYKEGFYDGWYHKATMYQVMLEKVDDLTDQRRTMQITAASLGIMVFVLSICVLLLINK